MAGWKEWAIGEVVEAGDFQSFIQDQTVMSFASSTARGTALGTAVAEGMVSYLQDSNSVQVYDGSAWQAVAPLSHNYIINGAFDIWQRGTSFTSGTNVYTADRWQYQASGATSTITQETFTPAELVANNFGDAKYYLSLEATVANDNAGIRHKVEDVRTLAGQTVTLSFWAKSDATSLKAVIGQSFGSGGSSFNTVATQTFTPTTSWVRYSFQYNVTSVSGKTIGDGSALEVEIANGNSELFTLDIWGVQLEAGSVATPFKRNASNIQAELEACRRYFVALGTQTNGARLSTGLIAGSTVAVFTLPMTLRAIPTISVSDLSHWTISSSAGTTAVTGLSTVLSFLGVVTVNLLSTGLSANNAAQIRQQGTTAKMYFDAEL